MVGYGEVHDHRVITADSFKQNSLFLTLFSDSSDSQDSMLNSVSLGKEGQFVGMCLLVFFFVIRNNRHSHLESWLKMALRLKVSVPGM